MKPLYLLETAFKDYDWGSAFLMQDFLNLPKKGVLAEMWMGSHPAGMSKISDEETLKDLLEKAPSSFFSVNNDKIGLDFLFKAIAVEKSLSVQIHPSAEDAKIGYDREEKEGIPFDSPKRIYKDTSCKDEMTYALTDFYALAGICSYEKIAFKLNQLKDVSFWSKWRDSFNHTDKEQKEELLKTFFKDIHSLSTQEIESLYKETEPYLSLNEDFSWIETLQEQHSYDPGIFSPIWMNIVSLSKGEALFTPSKTIHAYLKGFALEIMYNSDNVIRSSLTPKYKDLDEFLKIANFFPQTPEKVFPLEQQEKLVYRSPNFGLVLESISFSDNDKKEIHNPYLSLALAYGDVRITLEGESLDLKKGQAALIRASLELVHFEASSEEDSIFIATWK